MTEKRNYEVLGMSCSSCVNHVEKNVKKVEGVKEVNVSLLTNSMQIVCDSKLDDQKVIHAIEIAGYNGRNIKEDKTSNKEENDDENKEAKKLLYILIFSFIFMIPLFYLGMGSMLSWNIGVLDKRPVLLGIIESILSLIILILNKRFFISAFKSLIHKSVNMDTLVSLGSGIAFIYSFIILIIMSYYITPDFNNDTYMKIMHYSMNFNFETAGMIPTLITLGKLLESISKGKTTSAIKSLAKLTVKEATIIVDDKEKIVKSEELKVGDIILVKPGEYFPVDGIIVEGNCSVDESSLTGESLPIYKEINDEVKSSTINLNGLVKMKATKVGSETTLNKIIEMVKEASSTKAPITRIADRVSAIFVPTILAISFITFIVWLCVAKNFTEANHLHENFVIYSLNKAITVLVIACPCALGLATPVAIMVGSGKGAKNGILFKNATALENLSHINFAIFDKTGTITIGKPEVTDIISISKDIDNDELIKLAYSIEKNSKHPLANSVVEYSKTNNILSYEVNDYEEIAGKGARCKIDDNKYSVYSLKAIKSFDIKISDDFLSIYNRLSSEGKTPLVFLKNDEIIGIIAVKDVIKNDAKKTMSELKKMNITPIMLTGDNYLTAKKIASEVGIDTYICEVLPEEKKDVVSFFQKKGKVLMVGDGINDAPSLTQADSSIAISGSDIAVDSASIVLLKNSLYDVIGAINLSRYTLLNIKENLFFAFIYNIIMIPIAAGVFASTFNEFLMEMKPYYGAMAMSLSSVSVVLNALRLNLYNIYKTRKSHKKLIEIDKKELERFNKNDDNEYQKEVLEIKDMMCDNCVNHVSELLNSIDGIKDVKVSLNDLNATILKRKDIDDNMIKDKLKSIDYPVSKIIKL